MSLKCLPALLPLHTGHSTFTEAISLLQDGTIPNDFATREVFRAFA